MQYAPITEELCLCYPKKEQIDAIKAIGGKKRNGGYLVNTGQLISLLVAQTPTIPKKEQFNTTTPFSQYSLFDYQQKIAADSLLRLQHQKGVILGLDYGLGKTRTSLAIANEFIKKNQNATKILVIGPAMLEEDWRNEARIIGIDKNLLFYSSDYYTKIAPLKGNFFLIVDEAHRLAGFSARAFSFLATVMRSQKTLLLTGCPIRHGKPSTIYNLIRACGSTLPIQYDRKTFAAIFDNDYAIDAFYSKIAQYLIVIKKGDVLDLPPKHLLFMPIYAIDFDNSLDTTFLFNDSLDYRTLLSLKSRAIWALKKRASLYKIPFVISQVKDSLIKNNEGSIIFTSFVCVIEKLKEHFGNNAVYITGKETKEERMIAKKLIQSGERKIAICTFGAAGFGLTMTALNHCHLIDRPMSVEPSDVFNATDRIHRIGQKKEVFVYFWQLEGIKTPDTLIDRRIFNKKTKNEIALGRGGLTEYLYDILAGIA